MKSFKRIIFGVLFTLMTTLSVNAEDISTLNELKDCLAISGNTCTLKANVDVEEAFDITGDVILDLNGYTITANETVSGNAIFNIARGGKLTINDSSENETGKITVGSNTDVYSVVTLTKKGELAEGEAATIIVNGGTLEGYYYAIAGNGSRHNTVIEVNGGNLFAAKQTITNASSGIYQPQRGTVTINGGTISGLTGIEIRSGSLTVNGGTITGFGEINVASNGSGTTTRGVGIAVAQHTTNNEINVTINGGTIQGAAALYESTPETNPLPEKITISITGGKFETINEGNNAVYSENLTGFISGGTYTTEVDANLLASNELTTKEENGIIYVGKENTITINDTKNGTVKADKGTAIEGQIVTITTTADKDYELESVKVVDANGKEVKVENNKFTMPDSNVTVSANFKKVETVSKEEIIIPAIPETPKTGDNILLYVVLGLISIGGIAIVLNNLNKRKFN